MSDTKAEFNEVDAFWKHVRDVNGGDRTEIAGVSSPMIYTDIEDKIEQLRERMDRIETRQQIIDNAVMSLFNRSTEEWLAKPKSSKKRKRSK
jgi:hypothetical protein